MMTGRIPAAEVGEQERGQGAAQPAGARVSLRPALVCGLGIATVALLGSIAVAGIAWSLAYDHRDCPLGLEFERSASTVVAFRPIPPRAVCRYEYESADGEQLFPPSVEVYDAGPATVIALGVAATWAALLAALHRLGRIPPSEDEDSLVGVADGEHGA